MYSRLSRSARWDLKLNIFRVLKVAPISSVRSRFLRSYYGRLRRHTKVDLEAVFAKLPPNPVIVDLGANDRLFVPESVLSNAAEIHAVEPDPAIFELLRKSVAGQKTFFSIMPPSERQMDGLNFTEKRNLILETRPNTQRGRPLLLTI